MARMSTKQRKSVSHRMRRYWQEVRSGKRPPHPTRRSAAERAASILALDREERAEAEVAAIVPERARRNGHLHPLHPALRRARVVSALRAEAAICRARLDSIELLLGAKA
jgi:hypothetical protein